jgi:hypothetical protein
LLALACTKEPRRKTIKLRPSFDLLHYRFSVSVLSSTCSFNASNRTSNPWRLSVIVFGTVAAIFPMTLSLASAQSVTMTISVEFLISLKLNTVSAKSIFFPVETTTAVSKIFRRILLTARSPSRTFVTIQPARLRHFSSASQFSEQTSKVFLNRRGKLRTEGTTPIVSLAEGPTSAKARVLMRLFSTAAVS